MQAKKLKEIQQHSSY